MGVAAAGGLYFCVLFGAGFVLGTLRVMVLAPLLGHALATLAELPVMLAIAWFASVAIVKRTGRPVATCRLLGIGVIGVALLLVGEALLGIFGFGLDLAGLLAQWRTPPGLAGLAAQLTCALFPLIAGRAHAR